MQGRRSCNNAEKDRSFDLSNANESRLQPTKATGGGLTLAYNSTSDRDTIQSGSSLVLATCSGGGNAISPYRRGFLVPAETFRKRFGNFSVYSNETVTPEVAILPYETFFVMLSGCMAALQLLTNYESTYCWKVCFLNQPENFNVFHELLLLLESIRNRKRSASERDVCTAPVKWTDQERSDSGSAEV